MKLIACLFTLLLAACSSQPVAPQPGPIQSGASQKVLRYQLDASKLKTLNDVKAVLDSLQVTYTYLDGDQETKKSLQKIEKFLK